MVRFFIYFEGRIIEFPNSLDMNYEKKKEGGNISPMTSDTLNLSWRLHSYWENATGSSTVQESRPDSGQIFLWLVESPTNHLTFLSQPPFLHL